MTTTVLVLYYSRNGSVQKMAQQVMRGVESCPGVNGQLRSVAPVSTVCEVSAPSVPDSGAPYVTLEDLKQCDGLIIGTPTRFGNMAAAMKYFIDSTSSLWLSGALSGKPAGLFTSTSSLHGGQESTLLASLLPLLHHGMLFVGLPYSETDVFTTTSGGTPYGASHYAGPDNNLPFAAEEQRLCTALGLRVANIAKRLAAPN